MSSGYLDIQESAATTANTDGGASANNWGSVRINTPKNLSLPTGGVQWSHLVLILQDSGDNSQTDHTAKIFLSWDAAGDEICAGPSSAVTMIAGRTDVDRYMAVYELYPHVPTMPSTATVDTVYLWIQTTNFTDNTPTVLRARLHWFEVSKG